VQEITTTTTSAVSHLEQNEVIVYRNGTLPLLRLTSIFGLKEEQRLERPVLVIGIGLNAVGIVADRVLGQREIVIRSINDPLLKIPAISGATELGDGRAILIIDSMALIQTSLQQKRAVARARGQNGVGMTKE
jgi:two-component system chemotaxis sensor kinase CheA